MDEQAAYEAFINKMRSDFRTFLFRSFLELNPGTEFKPNWHLNVLAYELEQVRSGNTKRLVICVPPRSLKSFTASVAFPAYLLGRDPSCQIICVSYAQDLSDRFAGDCRALMQGRYTKIPFRLLVFLRNVRLYRNCSLHNAGFDWPPQLEEY